MSNNAVRARIHITEVTAPALFDHLSNYEGRDINREIVRLASLALHGTQVVPAGEIPKPKKPKVAKKPSVSTPDKEADKAVAVSASQDAPVSEPDVPEPAEQTVEENQFAKKMAGFGSMKSQFQL